LEDLQTRQFFLWFLKTRFPVSSKPISCSTPLFLRRRLGVQASQDPRRPGRLANPRLILFSLYFLPFSLIFTYMRRLASPCTRLGGWKGVDRLASPRLVALRNQLFLANDVLPFIKWKVVTFPATAALLFSWKLKEGQAGHYRLKKKLIYSF
jgi:hypothetical protein